jgi:hypothetical protein
MATNFNSFAKTQQMQALLNNQLARQQAKADQQMSKLFAQSKGLTTLSTTATKYNTYVKMDTVSNEQMVQWKIAYNNMVGAYYDFNSPIDPIEIEVEKLFKSLRRAAKKELQGI